MTVKIKRSWIKSAKDALYNLIEVLWPQALVDLAALTSAVNNLRLYVADGLVNIGTVIVSGVAAEKFKITTTAVFRILGVLYSKGATDNLTFTAAHVITAAKYGCVLVQIDAAGTVSTKVVATPQAYNTAALALAALPAADAAKVALGYWAIANNAGDWTANTDDLTNGSDVTTALFVDGTPAALPAAVTLTAESVTIL